MILRPRGKAVETDNQDQQADWKRCLDPEEVKQRIDRLIASKQIRLHDVFDDEEIHRACDKFNLQFRDRYFTPAITLSLFVSQVLSRGDACSTVIAGFNRDRKRQGLSAVCEDASAFCKARSRLPVELIDHLSSRVREIERDKMQSDWKWKGLNVYLVDGFVLRAPDTLANQAEYPQPSSQKEGLGFPQVRVVVTTSLAGGCVVHYSTGKVEGKKTGEVSLFREKHADFVAGDIVVGDSNFESFHDAVLLNRRGAHMVCCINGSRNSPFEGVCDTIDDRIIVLQKPDFDKSRFTREQWEALPQTLSYRVIRYRVTGRNTELTIVTTLTDRDRFPAADIAELYGLRWDVELDIRSYKSTMGMCELRCLTPKNLDREIAAGILGYNLIRLLMCDTAAVFEVHPRKISFSAARDAWRTYHDELTTTNDLMWIILSAGSRFVRNRPGRQEPRAIKRRQTKYPKLTAARPGYRGRDKSTAKNNTET